MSKTLGNVSPAILMTDLILVDDSTDQRATESAVEDRFSLNLVEESATVLLTATNFVEPSLITVPDDTADVKFS